MGDKIIFDRVSRFLQEKAEGLGVSKRQARLVVFVVSLSVSVAYAIGLVQAIHLGASLVANPPENDPYLGFMVWFLSLSLAWFCYVTAKITQYTVRPLNTNQSLSRALN